MRGASSKEVLNYISKDKSSIYNIWLVSKKNASISKEGEM